MLSRQAIVAQASTEDRRVMRLSQCGTMVAEAAWDAAIIRSILEGLHPAPWATYFRSVAHQVPDASTLKFFFALLNAIEQGA